MAIKMGTPKTDKNLSITNANYSGKNFNVSSEETAPGSLAFNSNGTKMFVLGFASDRIHQYSLGVAYDLSSVTYDNISLLVSGQEGFTFNTTGTEMYVAGFLGGTDIYQYSLSTGYDLTTASLTNTLSLTLTYPRDVAINSLGTKMFVLDYNSDAIYEYVFGTAFDLSTVTYNSVSFSVSGQDTNPNGIYFNSNGTRMFMVGQGNDLVYQYTLSTGFDLSTVTYDNVSFDVSTEDTSPSGIYFNPSGTRMFMVGLSTDSVYQYNL